MITWCNYKEEHSYGKDDIIKCLVKLNNNDIVRLNYNLDTEMWYYPSTDHSNVTEKKDDSDIVACVELKNADAVLNGRHK